MSLAPVPQPGIALFPGFTARKPEALVFRESLKSWTKDRTVISFRTPDGEPGKPFLELEMPSRKLYVFKSNGKEVMRIMKEKHSMSLSKGPEYHGYAPNGQKMFHCALKAKGMLGKTQFLVDTPSLRQNISIERSTGGSKMTILCNGQPVVFSREHNAYTGMRRIEHADIAPGMDLLLAMGLVVVKIDKEKDDARAAASAA